MQCSNELEEIINVKNKNSQTPAGLAPEGPVKGYITECVKYSEMSLVALLNEVYEEYQDTPINKFKINQIKKLIEKGVPLDQKDAVNNTALHLAAKHGWPLEIIIKIIDGFQGSARLDKINALNNNGQTSADLAEGEIAEYILKSGGKFEMKLLDLLKEGPSEENFSKVHYVIEKGVPLNKKDADDNTALHVAANNGWPLEIIIKIIECLQDSDELDAIIDAKNKDGSTPADLATGEVKEYITDCVKYSQMDLLNLLNEEYQDTPINKFKTKLIKELIDKKNGLNEKDADGNTALHLMAKYGWPDDIIIKTLGEMSIEELQAIYTCDNNEGETVIALNEHIEDLIKDALASSSNDQMVKSSSIQFFDGGSTVIDRSSPSCDDESEYKELIGV